VSAVVSDTSPIHYLVECEAIQILPALFGEVIIPPTVHRELQHAKTPAAVRAWAHQLPAWVKIQAPSVLDHSINLEEGEKEAICLAAEVAQVIGFEPTECVVRPFNDEKWVRWSLAIWSAAGSEAPRRFAIRVTYLRKIHSKSQKVEN
jgi:hypothetical protein